MHDLEVVWPDGQRVFSTQDSPIRIGRSSEASVPLTEGSVSRRHLELIWTGAGWTASDSSTHGTFDPIGVRLAAEWAIPGDSTIRLGGVEGVEVQIRLVSQGSNGAAHRDPATALFQEPGPGALLPPMNPATAEPPPSFPPPVPDREPVAEQSPSFPPPAHPPARVEEPKAFAPPVVSADQAPSFRSPQVPKAELSRPAPQPQPDGLFPDPPPGGTRPAPVDPPAASPVAPAGGINFDAPPPAEPAPPPTPPGPPPPGVPPSGGLNFDGAPPSYDQASPKARAQMSPANTIISDSTLRLSVDGQDYTFLPGTDVTIGRDPSCVVQLDERHSLVSRRHLQIQYRDDAWWLEDFSSKGTFVDSRKVRGPYRAAGAFVANMGDDHAGTPLRIITSGEHRVPRSWNIAVIGALALVALIPLVALAFLLLTGSSEEPDFASAKQSTVMLLGLEGGQGSGFFVADNLIVTNQHVAALSPQMLVAVSRDGDAPAQVEYATELVTNHPFLDIAVLRVTNRAVIGAEGVEIPTDPVGDIDLPAVTLGSSGDITLGEAVFSTGFPGRLSITSADDMGNLRLPPVSATSGEAASFAIWPGCSNPDWETFIPLESPPGVTCASDGDINNGVLVSTFSSGQGASGSAVFRDNEVVAVVFAGAVDDANASLNITTDSFSDWLQQIIDENG